MDPRDEELMCGLIDQLARVITERDALYDEHIKRLREEAPVRRELRLARETIERETAHRIAAWLLENAMIPDSAIDDILAGAYRATEPLEVGYRTTEAAP